MPSDNKKTTETYVVLFKRKPLISDLQAALNYENNVVRTSKYFAPQSSIKSNINNGYIAELDEETVDKLQKDDEVEIVEKDSKKKI
jgi:hypothetical protein